MPYRLIWEPPGGVYREYIGDVTIEERRESLAEICNDSRFDELRYAITNFLGVETFENNDEATIETAAMMIGPLSTNPRIVMAAVVTRPDILAAIQLFKSLELAQAPYEAFATVEEARRWIASAKHPWRRRP